MHPRSIKEYLLLSTSSFGVLAVTFFLFIRVYQHEWINVALDFVIIITLWVCLQVLSSGASDCAGSAFSSATV
jgi:hypothetical protein